MASEPTTPALTQRVKEQSDSHQLEAGALIPIPGFCLVSMDPGVDNKEPEEAGGWSHCRSQMGSSRGDPWPPPTLFSCGITHGH